MNVRIMTTGSSTVTHRYARNAAVLWIVTSAVAWGPLVAGPARAATPAGFEEVTPAEGGNWGDLPALQPAADDWPWWRGTTRDNKARPDQSPPLKWGKDENVVWKTNVPGRGHGSPCLWGDRIFLATADDKAQVQTMKDGSFVPTPLLHDGLLYVVNDRGLALCLDAKTGDEVWSQRLEGGFSASPILVGDKLFVPNEAGKLFVLQTGREFKLLAENDLQDGGFASPVICGSRIYLRTLHALYCLGKTL